MSLGRKGHEQPWRLEGQQQPDFSVAPQPPPAGALQPAGRVAALSPVLPSFPTTTGQWDLQALLPPLGGLYFLPLLRGLAARASLDKVLLADAGKQRLRARAVEPGVLRFHHGCYSMAWTVHRWCSQDASRWQHTQDVEPPPPGCSQASQSQQMTGAAASRVVLTQHCGCNELTGTEGETEIPRHTSRQQKEQSDENSDTSRVRERCCCCCLEAAADPVAESVVKQAEGDLLPRKPWSRLPR